MAYEKEVAILAGAGAAGIAQTYLVQKFVEPTQGTWVPQLGGFGKPAALLGIVGGIAGIGLGYLSMTRRINVITDPRMQFALLGYGGSALASGIVAGLNNGGLSSSSARAFPRTAAVRAAPAGYSQINKRETNIL